MVGLYDRNTFVLLDAENIFSFDETERVELPPLCAAHEHHFLIHPQPLYCVGFDGEYDLRIFIAFDTEEKVQHCAFIEVEVFKIDCVKIVVDQAAFKQFGIRNRNRWLREIPGNLPDPLWAFCILLDFIIGRHNISDQSEISRVDDSGR